MSNSIVKITEHEIPIKRPDGNFTIVRTEKSRLHDRKGNVVGVLGVALDVTDQRILEKKLNEETEKFKAMKQLSSTMAHELRTPYRLSKRQQECAYFLIRGYRYTEIARRLNIKISTVQTHIEHVKEKLKVSTHSQLIERIIDLGFPIFDSQDNYIAITGIATDVAKGKESG
jgi:DNA-binding CsgD family transcriptional regulator